ncbi:MAG: hemolysin III family protein [Bacillota bacterium]
MSNEEAVKESYKEYDLPYYTRKEEILNIISHGIGVPLTIIVLAFLLVHSSNWLSVIASITACFSGMLVFGVSAIYHAQTNPKKKHFWRCIDHGDISFLCLGCGVPVALCVNTSIFSCLSVGVCLIICVVCILLCQFNLKRYSTTCFILDFVIGFLIFLPIIINVAYIPLETQILLFGGVGLCIIGSVLYTFNIKYIHTIFHVFTLVGPIMAFVGAYFVV